jgi:hypothetical protein
MTRPGTAWGGYQLPINLKTACPLQHVFSAEPCEERILWHL